jgi:hypothetical protein
VPRLPEAAPELDSSVKARKKIPGSVCPGFVFSLRLPMAASGDQLQPLLLLAWDYRGKARTGVGVAVNPVVAVARSTATGRDGGIKRDIGIRHPDRAIGLDAGPVVEDLAIIRVDLSPGVGLDP